MDKTVLISLPVEDLQSIITDTVNACLENYRPSTPVAKNEADILNVRQASEFLNLAIPTIYSLTSNRILPHSKRGKKLYFSKADLSAWIKSGKRYTVSELKDKAKKL